MPTKPFGACWLGPQDLNLIAPAQFRELRNGLEPRPVRPKVRGNIACGRVRSSLMAAFGCLLGLGHAG